MKGPDGLCTDCGGTHDLWHAENPAEWEYREGCACHLCQEQERKMSRDTQFQGFAKLLTDELIKYLTSRGGLTLDEIGQEWRKIITRRAYDLVSHTVENVSAYNMSSIPDMAELPKEQDESD